MSNRDMWPEQPTTNTPEYTVETAGEQLGIPRESLYEEQSPDALIELRHHLLEDAQRSLDAAYEITDVLVGFEIEAKSRKKRVDLLANQSQGPRNA